MAKTSLQDLRGLPDVLQGYKFDVIMSNLPVGNALAIKMRCKTSTITGINVDDVTLQAHGIDLRYAGRVFWNGTIQLTLFETRDIVVRDTVRANIEFARNARTNTGEYKRNYEFTFDLLLYDDRNNVVRTIRHFGCHFRTLDEGTTSTDSTPIDYNATIAYDFSVEL